MARRWRGTQIVADQYRESTFTVFSILEKSVFISVNQRQKKENRRRLPLSENFPFDLEFGTEVEKKSYLDFGSLQVIN